MLIFKSLKARLIASALLLVLIVLPIIGMTLSDAFRQQAISSIKNELSAYSYSILAVAEVENNNLVMPEQLLENQFNVIQSGLYALFASKNYRRSQGISKNSNHIIWQSESFLGLTLSEQLPVPEVGQSDFSRIDIDSKPHFVYSFTVSFSEQQKNIPLTLYIIKDESDFLVVLKQFKDQLWLWIWLLMILLLVIQIAWLMWTLKPLRVLKAELTLVEQGEALELSENYPTELSLVAKQLNMLLATEQNQRQRYRNALSDLAHSLKTPLAVIQSQEGLSSSSQEQLERINQMIEHQLKRAQSAGESSWHLGVEIAQVIEKLTKTLEKIYRDKSLNFICKLDEKAIFKGDEADLMEILGNLLDNACKAAQQDIQITVQQTDKELIIKVADDGSGIPAEQRAEILQRGTRVDTYQQGHGIGLAIVRDLVASYQGQLTIGQSALGGALFIIQL